MKEKSAFSIKSVKVVSYPIQGQSKLPSVLGLAGMELTFFTAAHTLPCFVTGAKPVLVMPQYFGYS